MAPKKILVIGSTAYDLLLQYDGSFLDAFQTKDLEKLSAAFVTPHFAKHHGGTGANIAWNLALLNQESLLVTTVGSDGIEYKTFLKDKGIDVRYVEELHEHFTATAVLGTDNAERQIIFFHPGADAHGTFPDLSEHIEDIAYATISPRSPLLMLKAAEWCKVNKIPVFFDPGQNLAAFSNDDLQRAITGCTGVFVNDYEWSVLASRLNLTEDSVLELVDLLVITRGEDGVDIITQDGKQSVAACKADAVVNPTGAGDAFRAGFLTGLATNRSLIDSARLGTALASFVVEDAGTLLSNFDADHLRARAKETYGEYLPDL